MKMINFILWVCFLSIVAHTNADSNYCGLCKNHTMCDFKNQSTTCGEDVMSGISESEAEEIVFLHNHYRAKIANGTVRCGSPGPQPPAANMNAMMWDKELAEVAQRWADQCSFRHDECRRDSRFQVGQNIFISISPSTVEWSRAIKSWYSGLIRFNKANVDKYHVNVNTNSYTQIVWANTKYIGCGRTIFDTAIDDQQESVKHEEVMSSTAYYSSTKKNKTDTIATNDTNDTDSYIEHHRAKRQYPEGICGVDINTAGTRGALGSMESDYDLNRHHTMAEVSSDQDYYNNDDNEYLKRAPNTNVFPWTLLRSDHFRIHPQTSYQEPFTTYNTHSFNPVYPKNHADDDYTNPGASHVKSSYADSGERHYINGVFSKELLDSLGANEFSRASSYSGNEFRRVNDYVPGLGKIAYYVQTASRTARSINSENSNNHKDDNSQECEDTPNVKDPSKEAISQHSVKIRKQILICNYGPAGNIIDQPIYFKGTSCSQCPPNTTCKNGLCTYN